MKLTVTKPVEIEAHTIRVIVPVRYDDEDIPNDFPLRRPASKDKADNKHHINHGYDVWDATIDIDTGRIRNWPNDAHAGNVFMKVCDEGCYFLFDQNGDQLASIECDYVPECVPGQYGDYVDFKIGSDGGIANWKTDCNPTSIKDSFFRKED